MRYCCRRRKSSNLIKADARFLPFALLRRRYLCLQPQLEVNMQNGSIIRRNRKRHSDIWQFRWWEKTSEGKRIYRRREIGTVNQIPDLEAARKAACLVVLELNARRARSEPTSVAQLCSHFDQRELSLGNTWRSYSTLLRSVGTEFKVMQELLRHSTLRSTLDVYTQAITPAKHSAQAAVMSLVFSS